jgi:hypothetical protein
MRVCIFGLAIRHSNHIFWGYCVVVYDLSGFSIFSHIIL